MRIALRTSGPADEPFLDGLITETITLDLGASAWPEALQRQIIPVQVSARRNAVRGNFAGGESRILSMDGEDAGWVYYAFLDGEVRLVEVMLLERFRGRGGGSAAVRHVIETAAGKPVRLHVLILNARAIRLYERLGFRRIGGDEVQHLMEHAC